MKKTLPLIILCLLTFAARATGETLILGGQNAWEGSRLYNLEKTPGKNGHLDLRLDRTGLTLNKDRTDLLLPLNNPAAKDHAGHYDIISQPEYNKDYFRAGQGSAAFKGENSLVLQAAENGSLFSPLSEWQDFTIEFWIYPANPAEGESIFQWKGLGKHKEGVYSQSLACQFDSRRLVWRFNNIFQPSDSPISQYEISSKPVLPRTWSHHMLRYDSKTGILEYLVNAQTSSIAYTTKTGQESPDVHTPRIGNESGTIEIGANFTGFLDEFRIEKGFNDNPQLRNYQKPGYGLAPVQDLQYYDSRINKLTAVSENPGDSAVFPYFFISNDLMEAEKVHRQFNGEQSILARPGLWKSFDQKVSGKGRYLVLAFMLYPDKKLDASPVLSFLKLDYSPSPPPLPPENIRFTKEKGQVKLEWNPSVSPGIEGYLLYFGENPGEYIHPGSPLKIEKANHAVIPGLAPFKQYFFAIKSYTGTEPPGYSDFSQEISLRP